MDSSSYKTKYTNSIVYVDSSVTPGTTSAFNDKGIVFSNAADPVVIIEITTNLSTG